jgi:hypothetical protein
LALRWTSIPEWTTDAVRSVISSHSRVFEDPPQIPVESGELSAEKISATLPLFTAGLPKQRQNRRAAISRSKLWLNPKQIGWRVLIETKRGVTVAVQLHSNRKKEAFHQLQYGPSIQQTFDALESTKRKRGVNKQSFSPGILQIPALYFSALWLTSGKGRRRELFVPLVSYPGKIKIGRFYARKEIVAALVDKWIDRIEAHKKLKLTRKQRGAGILMQRP